MNQLEQEEDTLLGLINALPDVQQRTVMLKMFSYFDHRVKRTEAGVDLLNKGFSFLRWSIPFIATFVGALVAKGVL